MATPPAVTRDLFFQHGKACRVYDYADEYAKVNSAALAKGITIKEELKNQGFTDFSSFYMSCPKFSLACWPSALGNLGSGVVLYFHFLAFCAAFLVLAFAIQMPAVLKYLQADSISAWNFDPRGFDSRDISSCQCSGTNGGHTGPNANFSEPDYGKSCRTWDLDWCKMNATGPYSEDLGKWCCRSWCYASQDCPSTEDIDSPSMSNRYLEFDGTGLVRSYSACSPQPELSECSPESGMGEDVAYPHASFKELMLVESSPMRMMSPGNLGPREGEGTVVLACYAGLLFVFCMAVVLDHEYQLRCMAVVDHSTTQPNDFAILVEGLPGTATDELQIAEFFKEHAVLGRTDTEIVKVVIGWESEEYRENMRELKYLQKKLLFAYATSSLGCAGRLISCARCVSFEPVESIMERVQEVQERIRSSAPDQAKRLLSSGVAVVIFRYQGDHRLCLERWTSTTARYFYADSDGCYGLKPGEPLPRFFHRPIKVKRAPNPSDINWEDLGVSFRDRLKRLAKTNGCLLLLILVCFGIVYGMEEMKESMKGRGYAWSIIPVLGISISNMVLMMACKQFGSQEYWNTLSEQTASQSMKMAVAICVNTAGVIFFKNLEPKEWYKHLIDDVFMLMALTAVIQPLMFFWDFKYSFMGFIKRRNLTDEQIDEWNKVITAKPTTKEEALMIRKQRAQIVKQVEKMKEAFQPSQLDTTKRYAYAVRTFMCCLLFSPLIPSLCLVGVVGIVVQYWVDKYMLLRWFRRPSEPISGEQAEMNLIFMRYCGALLLPVAVFVFIHPSWTDMTPVMTWCAASFGFGCIYCIVPLSVARTLLGLRCMPCLRGSSAKVADDTCDDSQDYYKAQHVWTKEMKYHKSQFLYKMVPEKQNPEILAPGAYSTTSTDDLKGSYGVAAAALADGGGDSRPGVPSVHIAGHGPMDLGSGGGGDAAPGAAATEVPMTPVVVSDVSDDAPVTPAPADPAPEPTAPDVPEAARPVWKFETSTGFSSFEADCQGFIEMKYQEHLAGGDKRVNVATNGITVSLDFELLTQKVGRHGRVRKIMREVG